MINQNFLKAYEAALDSAILLEESKLETIANSPVEDGNKKMEELSECFDKIGALRLRYGTYASYFKQKEGEQGPQGSQEQQELGDASLELIEPEDVPTQEDSQV